MGFKRRRSVPVSHQTPLPCNGNDRSPESVIAKGNAPKKHLARMGFHIGVSRQKDLYCLPLLYYFTPIFSLKNQETQKTVTYLSLM